MKKSFDYFEEHYCWIEQREKWQLLSEPAFKPWKTKAFTVKINIFSSTQKLKLVSASPLPMGNYPVEPISFPACQAWLELLTCILIYILMSTRLCKITSHYLGYKGNVLQKPAIKNIAPYLIANLHMYTTRRIKVLDAEVYHHQRTQGRKPVSFYFPKQRGNHIRGVLLCGNFFSPLKTQCSNEVVVHYNCFFFSNSLFNSQSTDKDSAKVLSMVNILWCEQQSAGKWTKGMDTASLQGYSSSLHIQARSHLSGSDRDVCRMALSLS